MKLSDIFISARVALLGMITGNTRAIAVLWEEDQSKLLLRYYFKNAPSDEEMEMVSDVLGQIIGDNWSEIKEANFECITSSEPLKQLDPLSGWLFMRQEH